MFTNLAIQPGPHIVVSLFFVTNQPGHFLRSLIFASTRGQSGRPGRTPSDRRDRSASWKREARESRSEQKFSFPTMRGPSWIAKLVNITPITMVYGTYNYSYWGESKPTYNWGASHCTRWGPRSIAELLVYFTWILWFYDRYNEVVKGGL